MSTDGTAAARATAAQSTTTTATTTTSSGGGGGGAKEPDGARAKSTAAPSGARGLAALPEPVRRRLDEMKADLAQALGNDLAALLVYGSAARGGYRPGQSDVDVVVVLRDVSRPRLEAIANVLALARHAARIEAIILAADEIPRAADVFPLLYDDIRQCHVVLAGTDPFSALAIADRHRRLRIEQELRELQIRLRRMVVDALGARDVLAGAVVRKARQARGALHALLALRGERTEGDLEAVLAAAGRAYNVDVAPILRAHEAPHAAHAALVALLDAAITDVDARDDEPGAKAAAAAAAEGAR